MRMRGMCIFSRSFSPLYTHQEYRIVDILSQVESENASETHGISTPNLSNTEGGANDLIVAAKS